MSILPYLLNRRRALEQLCMNEDDWFGSLTPYMSGDSLYYRNSETAIKPDRSKFQINLDVHHFAPDEVSVKTAEGFIIVEGKHDEKRDDLGWISRQFCRRYPLPEGCNTEAVQSRLSTDGVLTVIAPLESNSNERIVPIIHTGPVRKETQDTKML